MFDESRLIESRIDSETVFDGRLLHVNRDTIEFADGGRSTREYIHHNGAVGIVALTDDGRVCIERQFRYPLGKVITEIPAGKLDSPDEDRLHAAQRELREETGITADNWEYLGSCYTAAAYTDEYLTLYLATGLHFGKQELDSGEFLNFSFVPLKDVIDSVMRDEIPDGKTEIAILKTAKKYNM